MRRAPGAGAVPPDAGALVVASHGGVEEQMLVPALRAGVPYVALVASRRRGAAVLGSLGLTPEQRARVHTPAGLNIGARGPAEIAVSIMAEIIASRTAQGADPHDPAAAADALDAADPADSADAADGQRADARGDGHHGTRHRGSGVARDPVCGMSVARARGTLRLDHGGTSWYFCSSACHDTFAANPEHYSV